MKLLVVALMLPAEYRMELMQVEWLPVREVLGLLVLAVL